MSSCIAYPLCSDDGRTWSRKEGERRLETELQAMERQERLNRLNIDVKAALDDSQNSEKNMK